MLYGMVVCSQMQQHVGRWVSCVYCMYNGIFSVRSCVPKFVVRVISGKLIYVLVITGVGLSTLVSITNGHSNRSCWSKRWARVRTTYIRFSGDVYVRPLLRIFLRTMVRTLQEHCRTFQLSDAVTTNIWQLLEQLRMKCQFKFSFAWSGCNEWSFVGSGCF